MLLQARTNLKKFNCCESKTHSVLLILNKLSCRQGVAEAESRRAADAAEAAYASAFDESVAAEEAALQAEHLRALHAARKAYADMALGDEVRLGQPAPCCLRCRGWASVCSIQGLE